jgi:hypothetical protein
MGERVPYLSQEFGDTRDFYRNGIIPTSFTAFHPERAAAVRALSKHQAELGRQREGTGDVRDYRSV